ncbi:MAG: hypothetical protein GVY06_00405 [Alphaproteobacteria bacterium]|jgi:phenylpropionate dioxygenase-like ring-hydroxylating dioxygenase large terminal subunit|nr:hypothetical protein [Alphaproteobacteria bacterium]
MFDETAGPQEGAADLRGETLISDVWYVAALSRDVPRGQARRIDICGGLLDVTRDRSSRLSATFDGQPARLSESEDLIWYFHPGAAGPDPLAASAPRRLGGPKAKVRYCAEVIIPAHQDDAAYGLLDPAHTPFVHKSPLWRGSGILKEKTKHFEPNDFGFTMVPHAPVNSDIYNLIGGKIGVRIEFRLPGLRAEYIQNRKHTVLGLTALTPVDTRHTRLRQIFYWDSPVLSLIRPVVPLAAKPFLQQDVEIMRLRRENEPYGGKGMLLGDSDRQFIWYMQIKREWQAARQAGREFRNTLAPTTLRWRT